MPTQLPAPKTPRDAAKLAACQKTANLFVRDGMKLGLGSGTTSHWFVRVLGERVRRGLQIVGVPTSAATRELAAAVGVPLVDLNDVGELDLAIDGADEIDRRLRMIKGGGACLLWEKIVARASRRMIAVVDENKVVARLGAFPLPVEVVPFGWKATRAQIVERLARRDVGGTRTTLRGGERAPLVTDGGHHILDCHLGRIGDPDELAGALNDIPGVVENGLFAGFAEQAVVGAPNGDARVVGPE